jgi:hypothetical protein
MVWSVEDEDIRALVKRLARSHGTDRAVIERAAILAEATDFASVIAWIADHDGQPEARLDRASTLGLHGSRASDGGGEQRRPPLRYVLPAETLK